MTLIMKSINLTMDKHHNTNNPFFYAGSRFELKFFALMEVSLELEFKMARHYSVFKTIGYGVFFWH